MVNRGIQVSKCWIKTDYVPKGVDYITNNKWYLTEDEETFVDDYGDVRIVHIPRCYHIDCKAWQVQYGDTPPDFVQEPTSNDNTLGDSQVANTPNLPVNEVQDVTEALESAILLLNEDCNFVQGYTLTILLDKLKSGEYSVIRNTNN